MGDDREGGVVGMLRQAHQRFPDLARRVQLCPIIIKPPQAKHHREKLWCLAHLLTQRVGLGVGALHLGHRLPFGHLQGRTEGEVQGQGLLDMLRRLWQGLEQLDPGSAVADGFQICRAVAGVLTRPLLVAHRLLGAARRSVVLGHQLRLRLDQLGKPCLQHLRNMLVILLTGAPQQGLIRRRLDEGVFAEIGRVRWEPALVHNLRLDQFAEIML